MRKGKSPSAPPAIILPYGIKNKELVTIDEVGAGLDCDCYCPACNNRLIARKGPLVKNSFAHYTVPDCNRGIEAGLQILCKDIIATEKRFTLPALYFAYSWRSRIAPEKEIPVDDIMLENKPGSLVPDICIKNKKNIIIIEITVNQRTSWERMQYLKSKDSFGVEIHLPQMAEYLFQRKDFRLTDDHFRQELIYGTSLKSWIHNPRLSAMEAALKKEHAHKRNISWFKVEYGIYYYVDYCPLQKRKWLSGSKEGQYYATVEDCNHCYFCLSKFENEKSLGLVYCIGHLKNTLHQLLRTIRP